MDGKGEKVRNILVTGADGFIGSHLCESLVKKGFKVRALSQYNSFNFWGHLEKSPFLKDMEVVSGDLRDSFFCEKITKNIDAIFHLGALIAIPYSYTAPQSYVDTNVNGTLNMLEAAKKTKFRILSTPQQAKFMARPFMCPSMKNTLYNLKALILQAKSLQI